MKEKLLRKRENLSNLVKASGTLVITSLFGYIEYFSNGADNQDFLNILNFGFAFSLVSTFIMYISYLKIESKL